MAKIEDADLSGWPLPDAYLIEIGRITALWNSLEAMLNVALGKLAGFEGTYPERAFILLNHSSFPQRLDMLAALCDFLKSEYPHLEPYKNTVSALKAAQRERNKYVHNSIVDHSGQYVMPVGSARGSIKVDSEDVTPAKIRQAIEVIWKGMSSLRKLIFNKEIQPPWHK